MSGKNNQLMNLFNFWSSFSRKKDDFFFKTASTFSWWTSSTFFGLSSYLLVRPFAFSLIFFDESTKLYKTLQSKCVHLLKGINPKLVMLNWMESVMKTKNKRLWWFDSNSINSLFNLRQIWISLLKWKNDNWTQGLYDY